MLCMPSSNYDFCGFRHLLQLLSHHAFGYLYLDEDFRLKVIATCLHQGRDCYVIRTPEGRVFKSLNEDLGWLIFELLNLQQGGYNDLHIVIEELHQEKTFQVAKSYEGSRLKPHEPVECRIFEAGNEEPC